MNSDATRYEWEFEYSAKDLMEGAIKQKEFRVGRVQWWTEQKAAVMREIQESGIEISESVAALNYLSNQSTIHGEPKVMVRTDLQRKLSECHEKIQSHRKAANEYDGWIQVLSANSKANLKLTHDDWLYFFGNR